MSCPLPTGVTCTYGEWKEWSSCQGRTKEAGEGVRKRSKTIASPPNGFCGHCGAFGCHDTYPCDCPEEEGTCDWAGCAPGEDFFSDIFTGGRCIKRQICIAMWTEWSTCTKTCGGGTRSRALPVCRDGRQ